ncbi:MAG TPA: hypothetical protein VHK66_00040, partial [Microvirga sp.]|nr:hypothetical protein [Microvirga sp.]
MNESVKPRFAVDLNEIEKHLGSQSQAAPATPPRSDPLAELARIVGQDDPFQTLLAGDRSSRHGSEPFADDLFVARDGARANRAAPGLRSPHELQDQPGTDPYSQVAASYAEYHAKVESDGDFDPNFSSSFQDGALDGAQGDGDDDSKPARRGSRKLFVTAGVVMGLAVLGLGGALMLNSPATMMAGGEPPLIKATSEPSKVQPQAPGGVEIPNQNKQIYERAGPQS